MIEVKLQDDGSVTAEVVESKSSALSWTNTWKEPDDPGDGPETPPEEPDEPDEPDTPEDPVTPDEPDVPDTPTPLMSQIHPTNRHCPRPGRTGGWSGFWS